ncbi:MAG: hypothetical protein CL609_01575 [Anaerolineaceae bacterium]|nr:hypothetical protein [Anaerolineaceae bacterium]
MKIVKIISILGVLGMTIALLNGFINGDFLTDGGNLLQNPWGIVSMVDLYTGFILFSVWIAYREKSILRSIIWIFFIMTLGFFTGSIYMLIAAFTSQNDWKQFWMGKA